MTPKLSENYTQNLMAVILAAGRGSRLHPITKNRTKAMAPVLGKPIIERVMDSMVINGIRSFIVVASQDDEEIIEHFSNRSQIKADIKIIQQPQPLGMGHALLQAAPDIDRNFMLSSCDNLVDPGEINQMLLTWNSELPNAILTTLQVGPENIIRMGIVEQEKNWISRIVEKPSLETAPSNIGSVPLYMFTQSFVDYLPEIEPSSRGEYELQDAIQLLIERDGYVRSFSLSGRRDLTTPADLLAINLYFFESSPLYSMNDAARMGAGTLVKNPVFIETDVLIGSNCSIGPNVYIEHGCRIGNHVHLENIIILRGRTVPHGSIVENQVIW
jgi:NDP-sugar pyrophosphorylase family protein